MTKKHRSKIKLLIDILDSVEENPETNLSYISLKANIPHNRLKPIINRLHKRGLINIEQKDRKTIRVSLTEEGYRFLMELKTLYKILTQIGLD
ncbi:MAG: winged helix-turn-helix domain-containing protein [Candidatus Njordarchaeota archaeon]